DAFVGIRPPSRVDSFGRQTAFKAHPPAKCETRSGGVAASAEVRAASEPHVEDCDTLLARGTAGGQCRQRTPVLVRRVRYTASPSPCCLKKRCRAGAPTAAGGDLHPLVEPRACGERLVEQVRSQRLSDVLDQIGRPPPQRWPPPEAVPAPQALG